VAARRKEAITKSFVAMLRTVKQSLSLNYQVGC